MRTVTENRIVMRIFHKRLMTATVAVAAAGCVVVAASGSRTGRPVAADSVAGRSVSKPALPDQVVRLITGDRVTLVGGATEQLRIDRGAGRQNIVFRVERYAGRVIVMPSDVEAVVAAGRLDQRLFDVAGLVEMGYDDAHTSKISLLVSYGSAAGARSARPGTLRGTTVARSLPVIDGAAVTVAKGDGAELLGQLVGGPGAKAGGTPLRRIWLDGKVRTTAYESGATRIGAPTAWKGGYTGKGVRVALLDTGVDVTHPDLRGRIAVYKNFTKDSALDSVGHGTHVASTLAGTGALSHGLYRGVAPDASLVIGKVLADPEEDGEESTILAGMEWAAVEQKARIVSMSLGYDDEPGIDPLEEAVNRLTARTGVLFVTAAGNAGPDPGLGSPATADAALAVGAVDKNDQLARFSSRGPRLEDGAIKPDVTAPGVDIIAARSKDSSPPGEQVGRYYVNLYGTSMATPHVAGAAAILAQQHPQWKAPELKAMLMSTAKSIAGQTAYEQGAGRIDVATAVAGTVVSEPGSLNFGTAAWPHRDDKPVVRTVTYRNLGTKPVKLTLNVVAATKDGHRAPVGALKLSVRALSVPAGGRATASVTSNTRHAGADGLYSGRVIATDDDGIEVGTPFVVDKEIETDDVTVRHLLPNGQGAVQNSTRIYSLDRPFRTELQTDAHGTAKIRLPKGRYLVDATLRDTADRTYQLVWPALTVDGPTTVVADARKAKPIKITVPATSARSAGVTVGYSRTIPNRQAANYLTAPDQDRLFVATMGIPAPAGEMLSYIESSLGVPGKDGSFTDSPYTYELFQTTRGRYWSGYRRVVRDGQLATVVAQYVADRPGQLNTELRAASVSGTEIAASGRNFRFRSPAKVVRHVDSGETVWRTIMSPIEVEAADDDPSELVDYPIEDMRSEPRTYQAGESVAERWGAAVDGPDTSGLSVRTGNKASFEFPPNSDQDGHQGTSSDFSAADTRLLCDGKLIASNDSTNQFRADILALHKVGCRLDFTMTRPRAQLATKIDYTWAFSTEFTDAPVTFPLWATRYRPAVDPDNSLPREPVTRLPFTVEQQKGAKASALRKITVQTSGDAGKTWTNTTVIPTSSGNYQAVFTTPATAKTISLRSSVADAAGNSSTQTIIDAYNVR
ncbi:S8 family peptidase [Kribbella sp. NPDC056861]|uniref:S8 family peptidase n=1 Tax=Kribbella sp. NPDC056861 TaxID=3154857 RepID=UPI003438A5C5